MHWYALVYSGTLWYTLVYSGTLRYNQVYSHILTYTQIYSEMAFMLVYTRDKTETRQREYIPVSVVGFSI